MKGCGALLALVSVSACGFNPSGLGTGSDAVLGNDDTAESTMGDPEASTGAGTGHAEGDTTAGEVAGDPTASGSDTAGSDTGVDVDPCAPYTLEIDAAHAMLAAPMQLDTSVGEGTYAYSEVANQGRASFQFTLPCEAEVRAWARVYDPGVGIDAIDFTDPDSFLVAFDGEGDTQWWYGCETADDALFGGAWAWVTLMDNPYCIGNQFRRTLSAGTHLLHLTNREAGNHDAARVAAVARVVVTTDPAYAP